MDINQLRELMPQRSTYAMRMVITTSCTAYMLLILSVAYRYVILDDTVVPEGIETLLIGLGGFIFGTLVSTSSSSSSRKTTSLELDPEFEDADR